MSSSGTPSSPRGGDPASPGGRARAGGRPQGAAAARRRRWFRLLLVLFPLVLLGGVELVLRVVGYGNPTAFFVPARRNGQDLLIDNPRYGWRFMPPPLARNPPPFSLAARKPAGTRRVLVFGESAALGDPEPAFGFPRILQVLLDARFPDANFEVVNTAMTAVNSHVIASIAAEAARAQGDVWVVYMGNNEVVGPFGPGGIFGGQASSRAGLRASLAFKTTRLGQWLAAGLGRLNPGKTAAVSWVGMEMFLEQQVNAADPRLRRVYQHFRDNLADIVDAGVRSGARVIPCTMVSNLRDCAPFGSAHAAGLSAANLGEWERAFREGCQLEADGNHRAALAVYQRALHIDPDHAELRFRLGRCLLLSGQAAEARSHFEAARDLDTLRFRADSEVNRLISRVAAGRESEGVFLLDAQAEFARRSPHEMPGRELLYEHVHFNFDGNYLLATAVADQIVRALALAPAAPTTAGREWLALDDCAQRLAFTDWNRYRVAELVQGRLRRPPFAQAANAAEQVRRLDEQMVAWAPALRPAALAQASAVYRQAVARTPSDWHLHSQWGKLFEEAGDTASAAAEWRAVIDLVPQYALAHYHLGRLLNRGPDRTEAIRSLSESLRLMPYFPEALNSLGIASSHAGKLDLAGQYFARAIALRPHYAEVQANWGLILAAQSKAAEAAAHYRAALQSDTNCVPAHLGLAKVLAGEGRTQEAVGHFVRGFALQSRDAIVHCKAGDAALANGNLPEAWARFSVASRLKPDLAEARDKLALVQSRLGPLK